MIINSDPAPRLINDYEFQFVNGLSTTIPISRDEGDIVDFETSPLTAIFHISAKHSTTNPDVVLPPEDITIFMGHVLMVSHHIRLVVPPTSSQKDEWKKSLHLMTKSIQ